MDDAGVVGLVDAYEHSVEAGVGVAMREPRLIHERTSLGETALHLLVMGNSVDAIRSIAKLGADLGAICHAGETPLSLAASIGSADVVRVLLAAGAQVAPPGQLEPTLHKAVRSGNVEAVQLLLDAGAAINEQADFAEARGHIAAEEGHLAVLQLLLSRGANDFLESTYGGTALETAQSAGKEACVALLTPKH